jgi:hypothetical protein
VNDQELEGTPTADSTESGTGVSDNRQPGSIDLNKVPEFQKWQSTMDKKLKALEGQAEADRYRAQQLEQQWQQERMQGMTEVEQALYKAQIREAAAAQKEQALLIREQAIQRDRDLTVLSQKLKVPKEILDDATDPMDAAMKAAEWWASNSDTRVQQQVEANVERRFANQVDIGGGSPPAAGDDLQRQYDKAMSQYDTSKALDLMAEAIKGGVKLKL